MKIKNLVPALALSAAAAWFPRPRRPSSRRTSAGSASTSTAASIRTIARPPPASTGPPASSISAPGARTSATVSSTTLYFGFAGGENFTYKIGYTGYFYTDDFDDTYQEINLGIGYGMFALDVAVGEWDGFGTPADYTFTSITIAPEKGPYYKFGSFGDDFDGDYFELGYTYSMEDEGIDFSIATVFSDDLPVSDSFDDGFGGESGEWALTFGIKKTIGISE